MPQPPAGKSGAGKGLALTALILAIVSLLLCWVPIVNNVVLFLGLLALVGVFATQAFNSSVIDGVGKSVSDSADGVVDTSSNEQKKVSVQALAVGTMAKVGDGYEATVTGINVNAGGAIAAASEYNEPAQGQYVLVDLAVKCTGAGAAGHGPFHGRRQEREGLRGADDLVQQNERPYWSAG